MPARPIMPWRPGPELFSDNYQRDSSYTNWRPHGSGDSLLIYTQAGAGAFVTSTGRCPARQGDVVLYAPRDMQDYSTCSQAGKWNLLWVHFSPKPHWQVWLKWPANEQGLKLLHLQGEPRRNFSRAMRDIIRLSRLPIAAAHDLAANALEKALIWAHVSVSSKTWLALDPRVHQAMNILINDLRRPFQMEALARLCHISPSRLAHLFKSETQTTPQQFLENHRIQQACTLLRITDWTIARIASEVGYEDAFYFTNRFRRRTGKSPTLFRKFIVNGVSPRNQSQHLI